MIRSVSERTRTILLLIGATFLLRLGVAAALGLGIDESYMVAAGRHWEWGYFDHPPLSWWLASGVSHLAGSEAAPIVRLPFIALFALSTWFIYRLGSFFFDEEAGLWGAILFNLTPLFGVSTGSFVLPDGPLLCALLGAALCLAHALGRPGGVGWWAGAGIGAGLALLSKYSAVLSLAGVLIFFLGARDRWRFFARPEPYLAAGLAALFFLPVIVWNARHHWVSFFFQGARAGGGQFHPFALLVTLAGEALFLLPWIWVPLMVVLVTSLKEFHAGGGKAFLAAIALVPIAFFALVGVWSSQRVLFHWAAPGYAMLFPLLGEAFARRHDRLARLWLLGSVALVGVGLLLVVGTVTLGLVPGPLKGLKRELQVVDWVSLRPALAQRGLLARPGLVVGATGWQMAGKLDYALHGQIKV
ncbi:MAG TPA: glycosyltransferase family 39 protein, partial [Stellaceae bacterium]|nr:glycosyltransferase family 39 protein [Stellaceae bacterium]